MTSLRELRLNNWVYSLQIGEYVQISSIDSEFVTLKDHVTWDYVYADMIEPIPLTEEILLKCGFDIEWLLIDCEGYYVLINNKKIRIKFVHSLQNIYLCIEQKELKLCL